jgi:hypothetical protein
MQMKVDQYTKLDIDFISLQRNIYMEMLITFRMLHQAICYIWEDT